LIASAIFCASTSPTPTGFGIMRETLLPRSAMQVSVTSTSAP
jgi:hypothetical protein